MNMTPLKPEMPPSTSLFEVAVGLDDLSGDFLRIRSRFFIETAHRLIREHAQRTWPSELIAFQPVNCLRIERDEIDYFDASRFGVHQVLTAHLALGGRSDDRLRVRLRIRFMGGQDEVLASVTTTLCCICPPGWDVQTSAPLFERVWRDFLHEPPFERLP